MCGPQGRPSPCSRLRLQKHLVVIIAYDIGERVREGYIVHIYPRALGDRQPPDNIVLKPVIDLVGIGAVQIYGPYAIHLILVIKRKWQAPR